MCAAGGLTHWEEKHLPGCEPPKPGNCASKMQGGSGSKINIFIPEERTQTWELDDAAKKFECKQGKVHCVWILK